MGFSLVVALAPPIQCARVRSRVSTAGAGMAISKGEGVQVSQRGDQRHGRSLFPSHLISLSLPFSFQSTLSPFLLSYSAPFSISLAFLPLPTLPIVLPLSSSPCLLFPLSPPSLFSPSLPYPSGHTGGPGRPAEDKPVCQKQCQTE